VRTAVLISLSALSAFAACQNPKNMTFTPALKSVAVFRDGFGYFVREGRVKLENGWATTNLVPTAIRGTVRFYTLDKADHIDQIVIAKENKLEFDSSGELKQRLSDKIGLRLVVVTKAGGRFEGELAKVLDDMLLLKASDAYNAVPYEQVREILLPGYPVRIKVDSSDPNKVVGIGMAYLQDGIRWDPSYVLDMSGKSATLALRASMQNTTESLKGTDVYFVVGSPFVANRGIADLITPQAAPAPAVEANDKQPEGKASMRDPDAPAPMDPRTSLSATITREEAGELYYYRKPALSLSTNDVAMVSVFEATVPVSPRFEWNADTENVSYLLSISNKSGQPLTTGPVLVLENGRAMGQETVRYTPAGANAEIRLSQGIGLKVEKTEAEVKRGGAVRVGRTDYIPVSLKGTLTITNTKSEPAELKVTKTLRGKVGTLSDEGIVKQTQILSGEPNPINDVEWKVSIPAGATKTITYTFETYMSAERAGAPPVPISGDGG
jgi:hypothetical protein